MPMEKKPTDKQMEEFMRAAALDQDMFCSYCGARVYESDYKACAECNMPNPYRKLGLV